MRDSEVVAAIVAGDPVGLAEAYDRYATPLYRFCRTMLREPADAADAVQDTFVIAAPGLSGLRDRERLRSWLYAVARNECHRKLRSGSLQTPIDAVPELSDEAADVAARVEEADLRTLVRDALAGVVPAEREILELQLRQGLSAGEVAGVLGVSRNHAHALLSRARDQLETSLAALVVARTGRQDCADLDAMLQDWDGRLTVLLRKRINRHVERCLVCAGRRRREVTPAMLLGIAPLAALPLAARALPAGLRDHVLQAAAGHSPMAQTAYAFGRDGFPQPLHPHAAPWWHLRPAHLGAVAGTAAAVAAGVTWIALPPHPGLPPAAGASAGPAGARPGRQRRHQQRAARRDDADIAAGTGVRVVTGVRVAHRDHDCPAGRGDAERQPDHARRGASGQRRDHAHRPRRHRRLVGLGAVRPGQEGHGGADVRHAGRRRLHHGHRHRDRPGPDARAPGVQPRRHDGDSNH